MPLTACNSSPTLARQVPDLTFRPGRVYSLYIHLGAYDEDENSEMG